MRPETCRVSRAMRRGIEIRVVFAPTRLSAMHLRAAYAMLSPAIERMIVVGEGAAAEREGGVAIVGRRRATGGHR